MYVVTFHHCKRRVESSCPLAASQVAEKKGKVGELMLVWLVEYDIFQRLKCGFKYSEKEIEKRKRAPQFVESTDCWQRQSLCTNRAASKNMLSQRSFFSCRPGPTHITA